MSGPTAFAIGLIVGAVAMLWLVTMSLQVTGTLSACRAAHPGYECNVGWVVGEAFK